MNNKYREFSLTEICEEIDLIIKDKDDKQTYKLLYSQLDNALLKEINYLNIDLFCQTLLKIAHTKNKRLRMLEKNFWYYLSHFFIYKVAYQQTEVSENEELDFHTNYPNLIKRILSRLIGLSREILQLADDGSKSSEERKASALKIFEELINYYHIPGIKNILWNSIPSKREKEQYHALEGLHNYYLKTEDDLTEAQIKILNKIHKTTKDNIVASNCLIIQIEAGHMKKDTAVRLMDGWKKTNYYF